MIDDNITLLKPISPHPALLLMKNSEKYLVVADLHLGWEASLAERGVHIPLQTHKILKRIERIISAEKPDCLIILGDIKHTIEKIELEEWRNIPVFFENLLEKISCIKVVPGNHDGDIEALLPEEIELMPQKGIVIGDAGLFHGHAWPDFRMLSCKTLIIGHIHPVVSFKDPIGFRVTSQVWVRAPCNSEALAKSMLKHYNIKVGADDDLRALLKSKLSMEVKVENLLIMPSFNDFLGGRAVNRVSPFGEEVFRDFIGPILRSGSVNLREAEVYLLDGTFIGLLKHLIMPK